MFYKNKAILLSLVLVLSFAVPVLAQNSASQRIEIMRQKLDTMRRSLDSAISVLKNSDDAKKSDKSDPSTPLGRLTGLDKEVSSLNSDVQQCRRKD